MPVFQKDDVAIELRWQPLDGEDASLERQCAWEVLVELTTRLPAIGRPTSTSDATSRAWTDAASSALVGLVRELRPIMRRYPTDDAETAHLGAFLLQIVTLVINPYLDRWGMPTREHPAGPDALAPDPAMAADLGAVISFLRASATALASAYRFPDVLADVPESLAAAWQIHA